MNMKYKILLIIETEGCTLIQYIDGIVVNNLINRKQHRTDIIPAR